jgi:hypothetical protein
MASKMNPTTTTSDGLVMKNTGKIEDVFSRLEARLSLKLASWQCSRYLRRDFNIVSEKMFRRCRSRNPTDPQQIRGLLEEFSLQAEMLKAESLQYDITQELIFQTVDVRIVSPESMQLVKAFKATDEAMVRVICAFQDQKISKEEMENYPRPAFAAYSDLKQYILRSVPQRTATEMAQEQGVT